MGGHASKNDLPLDQEMAELTKHVTNLASFQKQLQSLVNGIWQSKENKKSLYDPRDLISDNSPTLTPT